MSGLAGVAYSLPQTCGDAATDLSARPAANTCGGYTVAMVVANRSVSQNGNCRVDFDADTSLANLVSVSSNCSWSEEHYSYLPVNTCSRGSDLTVWRPVQISFDVTQSISSADIYVSAFASGTTYCVTGKNCVMSGAIPPVRR